MRVITNQEGKPMCYHCGRAFERHPEAVRREELHAKLCAIEDDELAARAFHYHRKLQADFDQMETVWVELSGFSIPDVGILRFEGARLQLEPGASHAKLAETIENCVLPFIKENILSALAERNDDDKTEAELRIASASVKRFDPTWFPPSTPTAAELYPSGYVRREDGSVESA
jgi:hypothetical protein